MFITFRRRNYDKATMCQLSDIIYYLKENKEVASKIQEFLQILTEKKVEIFNSVLRRLVNIYGVFFFFGLKISNQSNFYFLLF